MMAYRRVSTSSGLWTIGVMGAWSFTERVTCVLLCLAIFIASSPDIRAQDVLPAVKESIAGLEKALAATKDESSEARQRLAVRRVIRDAEELVAAHPQDNIRFPALEFLFRARQQLISLDKDAKNRAELLETCRELVKAPAEFAELRLEADLLLSQADLAKQGAGNAERAQALRPFVGRYLETPLASKALRVAMIMALELGDSRVVSYLQETMEKRFSSDLEMIKFQRDKLGGQVIGAPFVGAFERSDGKIVRFPMEGLGRTTMLVFWTKNTKGEALLRGIAATALQRKREMAGRFEIVTINLDDLPDAGESFVRSLGVDWKVLRLPGGKSSQVYHAYARSPQRLVIMSPTGIAALTMPEGGSGSTPANAMPDFTRSFQSFLAREWTYPRYLSQLTSLAIGEFLVIDPEVGIDPARPLELKAAASGGEVQPLPRDSTCVPDELLRAIQACFVAPPFRYNLPLVESGAAAHPVEEGYPLSQRFPLPETKANYAKAVELCRKAIADHASAPDLWIVRNRLIIALMGLWKCDSDVRHLEAAVLEAKAAMSAGFPKDCDGIARLCLARGDLLNPSADPKGIVRRFVSDAGGDAAIGPTLAAASLLALDVGDRSGFENYRSRIIKSHTEHPMMWTFSAFLLDCYHDYWLFQVPFVAGWTFDRRQGYFMTQGHAEEARRMLRAELRTEEGKPLRIPEDLEQEWTMIVFAQPGPWSVKHEDVRGWMQKMAAENKDKKELPGITWYVGYGGISLCEYYLRTGDASILHTIKLYADAMQRTQFNGAWGHKGIGSCSYAQSGHLNAAGVHVLTFLMLAKECGVDVDETMLQSALKYFYKFAGHGNVAYGDSLPETSFVDNGKTGGLAFALGAAASLTPEGEKSVYAKARDISAGKSFYSTSWMLHGHTGGGIGEIWRGAAMGLVHEKQPQRYREFMNDRAWFYDLSRRFDGSFGIIGGGRYDDPWDWGLGMGLAYTIPRKHLRMAGGAATKFCKSHALPERPWGSKADDAFYLLEAMPMRGDKPQDVDKVALEDEGSWPVLRKLMAADVSDETLMKYAHHPELGIREYAMNQVRAKNRTDLVVELLKSKDPRGRHTGILGITEMNDEIASLLLGMVADPDESWWVARSAMEKLELVRAELLLPHKDRLVYWLKHPDWWMHVAALAAVKNLLLENEQAREIMPIVGDMVTKSVRPGPIWQLDKMLRDANPEVKALALQSISKAYAEFPKAVTTAAGVKVDTAEPVQVGAYAWLMAKLPAGYDSLYKLGKQRYPNQTLAHQKLFLEANYETFGKELREQFQQIIREQLIPEFIGYTIHIGSNRKLLKDEANSAEPFKPSYYVGRPRMDDLVDFYRRLGVKDYDWHDFGPAINTMKWDYHTFDPPEPCTVGATTRFRKVSYPSGMENWFAKDFHAANAGWKSGLQPIGQIDGKLANLNRACRFGHCRCSEPMQTLWEKEVLLARGNFDFPKFKEGHRYRLIFGGMSHPGEGDGFQVYVNGKLMLERPYGAGGGRENGLLLAYNIDKAWWPDFENGNTTIAAKGFLPIEPSGTRNTFLVWLQEMKCPPLGEKEILESVKAVPMFSAAWQAVQDSENMELDPENGKYRWDGKFASNSKVVGTWTQMGEVASAEAFTPTAQLRANGLLPAKLTFAANGRTDDYLIYYTGDTLLHLNTNQALGMSIRTVDGVEHLFIEAGGFSPKNPPTWKSPVVVMKKTSADRK